MDDQIRALRRTQLRFRAMLDDYERKQKGIKTILVVDTCDLLRYMHIVKARGLSLQERAATGRSELLFPSSTSRMICVGRRRVRFSMPLATEQIGRSSGQWGESLSQAARLNWTMTVHTASPAPANAFASSEVTCTFSGRGCPGIERSFSRVLASRLADSGNGDQRRTVAPFSTSRVAQVIAIAPSPMIAIAPSTADNVSSRVSLVQFTTPGRSRAPLLTFLEKTSAAVVVPARAAI